MRSLTSFRLIAIAWGVVPTTLFIQILGYWSPTQLISVGLALMIFVLSLFVWGAGFLIAIARSKSGEAIEVSTLLLADQHVSRSVRLHLYGALSLTVIIVGATAINSAFGVLIPMLSVALIILWAAKFSPADQRFPVPGRRE